MANELRRIDIGFQGGQVLPTRVSDEDYRALREALEDARNDRWHVLETQDSEVALDLSQVVYVRRDTDDQRVGF